MKTLRDQQLERELSQVQRGVERYEKGVAAKQATEIAPGQTLLHRAMEPVIEGIEEELAKPKNRRTVAASYLEQLEPAPVAYITARVMINNAAVGGKLTATAMSLARMIEEHVQFMELEGEAPALANSMQRKAMKWTTSFHRRAIMRKAADIASVRGLEWSQGDKLKLGMKLVELFIVKTGLAEHVQRVEQGRKTKYLELPKEVSEWILGRHEQAGLLSPLHEPMISPPLPWSSPIRGGFLTREMRRDFILQTKAETRDDLFSTDLDTVYKSINSIQATPWRINRAVYDVMLESWDSDSQLALPARESLPLPEKPDVAPGVPYDELREAHKKIIDEYRKKARKIHEHNARLQSQRFSVARKLEMATDVLDRQEIWFPHNVDFRGRIYPLVSDLSPQGDDTGKGLLEFARGKPLGNNGAYWLAVHIANLFGIDKVSFDDRVKWTQDHTEQLIESAMNPLDGQRFWTTADSPWQALAAAFEWAGYSIQGEDYVSHLPIAMDGSCSGLQHFSAMLKDQKGACATNLVDNESPSDIYMTVADETQRMLGEVHEPLARAWDGMVIRKIVKRPCMTFAYSVTSRGIRDQIADEMRKQANGGEYLPGWDNFTAASFLAPIVEQAIRNTVDKAAIAMDWLKEVTKVLLEEEMPVLWYTPDGFPVLQKYVKQNGKKFKVYFQGQRLRLTLRVDTTKPDSRKQASAIAPNYVHSMDAAHLRMVVNRMVDEGVTRDFAMIHDSFGVHAADVDELHYVIRDEFVKLYDVDRLKEFYQQALLSLPGDKWEELETPPEMGEFNLEEVRDADFFFA